MERWKIVPLSHRPIVLCYRDAGGGGAGGACAPPSFGISVNPIRTKGGDYARHITTGPPIFLDDAASLVGDLKSGNLQTNWAHFSQVINSLFSFTGYKIGTYYKIRQ